MLTLWIFLAFALSLSMMAEYLRPYAPLLRLSGVTCPACGVRRWRVT